MRMFLVKRGLFCFARYSIFETNHLRFVVMRITLRLQFAPSRINTIATVEQVSQERRWNTVFSLEHWLEKAAVCVCVLRTNRSMACFQASQVVPACESRRRSFLCLIFALLFSKRTATVIVLTILRVLRVLSDFPYCWLTDLVAFKVLCIHEDSNPGQEFESRARQGRGTVSVLLTCQLCRLLSTWWRLLTVHVSVRSQAYLPIVW